MNNVTLNIAGFDRMLSRVPRLASTVPRGVVSTGPTVKRDYSAVAPTKVECFIDGKKVLVDPGTTVLQVNI